MNRPLVAEPIRLTYQDFCALPDNGRRYEILDGDLYMSPSPTPLHQHVLLELGANLRAHVKRHDLGRVFIAPLDVLLSEHDIVEPDIIFVSKARESIITAKNIVGVPDLLVEIISPSNTERDVRDKQNIYARCGVPFYWMLDPEGRSIIELQLVGKAYARVCELSGDATFTPRLFPGLAIELSELWG